MSPRSGRVTGKEVPARDTALGDEGILARHQDNGAEWLLLELTERCDNLQALNWQLKMCSESRWPEIQC